jgi:hypothetical protein
MIDKFEHVYCIYQSFSLTFEVAMLCKNMIDIWVPLIQLHLLIEIVGLFQHQTIRVFVYGNGKIKLFNDY